MTWVQVRQGDVKDILAVRTEDEEALCAVCSGGLSAAPNLIVFCERCDIAVHQRCYGVEDIPAGQQPPALYMLSDWHLLVPKTICNRLLTCWSATQSCVFILLCHASCRSNKNSLLVCFTINSNYH